MYQPIIQNQRHRTFGGLFLAILTLLMPACNQKEMASNYDQGFKSFVYAYTSGMVSKASPIRVRFTQSVVGDGEVGNAVKNGVISFSPSIKGELIWEDEQTILLQPAEPLASGKKYEGSVRLTSLFGNVPADLKTFKFNFQTLEQHAEVLVEGLRAADLSDLKNQEVFGTIYTTDIADADEVEKMLEATQKNNEALSIRWDHDGDQQHHHFVIQNVARSEQASEVKLKWNGKAIGTKDKGSQDIEVPALGDFKVMDVNLDMSDGIGQNIRVFFSDPISTTQDLTGMIKVQDLSSGMTFTIDKNIVTAFPSSRITGDRVVEIARGIKNIAGKSMPNPSQWSLTFESAKPQVRALRNGVIMPNSNGLIFPFEAISLNAVDVEIFKIYENNIIQFLQTNDLSGNYQLKRVGRVVFQKRIALSSINSKFDANKWTHYALDLNDYLQREPNAIYQIRIGFQKSYSTYFCSSDNSSESASLARLEDNIDEEGEIISFWDGSLGYFPYRERDNPCHEAYYKSYYRRDHFAMSNVIASDFGLIAKKGKDGSYFVAVSDLVSPQPMGGITIKFYDYQQQVIKEMKTDSDGIAQTQLKKRPFVIVAEKNDMRGYLKVQDGSSLSLSRFDVSGAEIQKGLKGFIYGERGVWRPGDTMFLNFILEDKKNSLPKNHPVTFELYDARGQLYTSQTIIDNVNHVYDFTTVTKPEDATGNWMVKVKVGGAVFQKGVRVETVKPNRLKIALDFGGDEIYANNDLLNAKMQVNWLHGAPARSLKAEVKVQLRSMKTEFKQYADFNFDDPARTFSAAPKTVFNNTVNNDGFANFNVPLNAKSAPGMLKADFTTRVFENSGDFSTDNVTLKYHPYETYVGIQLPEKKYTEKRLDLKKEETVSFVVLDPQGRPMAGRRINIGTYKVNWRWWWDSSSDNVSNFSSAEHFGALNTKTVTTNSQGVATFKVKFDEWGRYMIRACDVASKHCTGEVFYVGYPWDDNNARKDAAAMLNLETGKKVYNVGETVELKVPMGKKGRALLTLENGSGVVETFWMDAKEGENTFRFQTTKDMTPTIYAHVSLLQPHAQVTNDLPIRMYGVIPVKVEDPKTRLEPTAAVKDAIRPNEKFTVKVSESNRRAMAYTLAIVDEGLLDLTRFKTPEPWQHFYAREALGVTTWDLYDDVMGAYGGKIERVLSIGGDMGNKPRGGQKANRFKPVVMHLGPFYLKKGQTKTHQLTMPNYVGAVRVMVVAADNGAYGHFEKSVKVKKPLMVLGTLPRVLSPGETVKLPATVFAMEKFVKNAKVTVKTNALLGIKGSRSKSLTFKNIGDQIADFELEVADQVGVGKVTITATSGKETSYQEIEIDVRNPNPFVTNVQEAVIQAGKNHSFNIAAVGMKGTNKGMVEVSNIPPINLGERLDYLMTYPHGCIEQTTSSGFPQLYVNKLLELDKKQSEQIKTNITATIDRIRQFQTASGGFAYWPGHNDESHWGSNYAGHFLLEAEKLGYNVPSNVLVNWKKFQKKTARSWRPRAANAANNYLADNDALMQAYRLYTLALAGNPELGAMNRLREMKNLSATAQWRLAAAYAAAGKEQVAKQIISNLPTTVKPYQELGYTYGSDVRDRAMILETLTLLKDQNKAAKVVIELSKRLSANDWLSTQTIGYSLLAIGKYMGGEKMSKKFRFVYAINGGTAVNAGSNSPMVQIDLDMEKDRKVSINNNGSTVLYARSILSGQPMTGDSTRTANDLKLAIRYTDMAGAAIDPSMIPQGTDFIAEVAVTHPGVRSQYDELALTQAFPSGWEIYNTRLNKVQAFSNTNVPEYQDIRDDRVLTYFDLGANATQIYRVQLNAAYEGRFYLPTVACSAMYDNSINARQPGQWVQVMRSATNAN